ncbi:hypothetical protein [Geobacter sp.]|uniref:hypothetical protein n=1 Tax=Geobacter sp. TaxID=46610 RepID=UPI0027BA7770|nr:hypothetical protein [Geobacter sp.]
MLRHLMSYTVLIPASLILGLAPFPFAPEPHLVEKSRMFMAGTLTSPVDIFDVVWHAWPLALLGFKAGRDLGERMLGKREEP